MDVRGLGVAVFGMGESGVAVMELLLELGARVRCVDLKRIEELPAQTAARISDAGVPLLAQDERALEGAGLIVLSPGVSPHLPLVAAARARGIAVTGELEFASRFLKGPILGITGSNGKTTVTSLCGRLLAECGIPCQVGANIGRPVAGMAATSRDGVWNVLELSSFMLEMASTLHVRIAAVLNVTPDHLDRHGTMEAYTAAKARIFLNQTASDHAVLNFENGPARGMAAGLPSQVHFFSAGGPAGRGFWMEQGELIANGRYWMPAAEIPLRGRHNVENVLAAGCCAHLAGAPLDGLRRAVAAFPGVEHRLELAAEADGVRWYNDSKATNVDAALKAIAAFDEPLWIILGGRDKGSDYRPLIEPLRARARGVLLIGEAADLIASQFEPSGLPVERCGGMAAAVAHARAHARSGDIVVLAPACASFDQYENYGQRGRHFKELAARAAKKEAWP
jgi:UDP-N-acetylmuramoylalanine--D-glutamate ligase